MGDAVGARSSGRAVLVLAAAAAVGALGSWVALGRSRSVLYLPVASGVSSAVAVAVAGASHTTAQAAVATAPATSAAVAAPPPSCAEVRAAAARALAADPENDALTEVARGGALAALAAAAPDRVGCFRLLLEDLLGATRCERAYQRVASVLMLEASADPDALGRAVARRGACQRLLVHKVMFAEDVSRALAQALLALTNDADSDLRGTAWYALGAVADTARKRGRREVVELVERTLAVELAREDERLPVLLRAAGNAGCEACLGAARRHLASGDADLRRGAVLAWRLVDTPEAVRVLCERLGADEEVTVRAVAAVALRAAHGSPKERVECLARAALDDADTVAKQALASLSVLASEVDYALGALVSLARDAERAEVRALARKVLGESPKVDPRDLDELLGDAGSAPTQPSSPPR
jgi:hypothetical protein